MVKLATKGHFLVRMTGGAPQGAATTDQDGFPADTTTAPATTTSTTPSTPAVKADTINVSSVSVVGPDSVHQDNLKDDPLHISPAAKPLNLFADSSVPCFFRYGVAI